MLALGKFLSNYLTACTVMTLLCFAIIKIGNLFSKRSKNDAKKDLDDLLDSPYGQILQSYTGDLRNKTNQILLIVAISVTPVLNLRFWAECLSKDKS